MPLKSWILRERLKCASEMLQNTHLRISEIAHRLGFNDVYIFSKQFKNHYREGPLAHRKRLGQLHAG